MRKKIKKVAVVLSMIMMCSTTSFAMENTVEAGNDMSNENLEIEAMRVSEVVEEEIQKADDLENIICSLDISQEITQADLDALSEVAEIQVTERDEGEHTVVDYDFTPKNPIEMKTFKSGRSESTYHKIVYSYVTRKDTMEGNHGETTKFSDLTLRNEIFYSMYNLGEYMRAAKLCRAEGTIVEFLENGKRNLGISTRCIGERYDDNGVTHALGSENLSSNNVEVPLTGETYKFYPNYKYYYSIDVFGVLKSDVHLEYRHGEQWYGVASTCQIGVMLEIPPK